MFWPDVVALKNFYASPLGILAQDILQRHVRRLWPSAKDDAVLGLGFVLPLLSQYVSEAQRVIACMPAAQGVIHWPQARQQTVEVNLLPVKNCACLVSESELPFADNSIQRMIVMHALENTEEARAMMSEVWRVLSPTGRVIVIVPNRMGLWARAALSPFAYGHPFSHWQLRQFLTGHGLTPLGTEYALFFPPARNRVLLRVASMLETIGSMCCKGLGGVLMMEAEKRIYAPIEQATRSKRRRAYLSQSQPVASASDLAE